MSSYSFRFSFPFDPSRLEEQFVIELAKYGIKQIWIRRKSIKVNIKNITKLYLSFHFSTAVVFFSLFKFFEKIHLKPLADASGYIGARSIFKALGWMAEHDESFRKLLQETYEKYQSKRAKKE